MRGSKWLAPVISLLLVLSLSLTVLAVSDITNAEYKGQIRLVNTSTATINNAVPFTLSTANMITAGMLNATATDAAVRYGTTDVYFMPGWGANPWVVFVPTLGANGSQYDMLYSKGVTGGYYRYFPAAGGMTAVDAAGFELGNEWEVEFKGYLDTSAGANKDFLLRTPGLPLYFIRVYVSGAGTITASLLSGASTVSAAVASGEHTIKLTNSGGLFKIWVDGTEIDSDPGQNVVAAAEDWQYCLNGSMVYMEYFKVTISGTLQQHIIWTYGATFNDQSAGNNDTTPAFRTTSTDADVSASLVSLGPAETQEAPAAASGGVWDMIPSVPAAPASLYTELGMTFWGAGLCQDYATYTSTPLAVPVFCYAFGLSLCLGLLAYRVSMGSKKNGAYTRKGSLFIQTTVSGLVLWYFVANGGGVIPGWCLIPFAVIAIACMVWEKSPYPWS